MIDFTDAMEELNNYKGSEKKKTLIYDGKKYLVKFPDPVREKNKNISYINNAFSEYVGSNVFRICGFKTQNTLLGTYTYNGKEKIVCACEDFTDENHVLYEFENLALSANPDKKIETELSDIMEVIDSLEKISKLSIKDDVKKKFWDMFVVDSIIGNTDRHNGNWGILVDTQNNCANFAPIYDCGSCLNPMLEDQELEKLNNAEIKNLAVNSYSCLKENGKKINYMQYIQDCKENKNKDCNEAIIRIFPQVNIEEINKFIMEIPCISNARKNFYKEIINFRYDIIKEVYEKNNGYKLIDSLHDV